MELTANNLTFNWIELSLLSLNTELNFGADNRLIKFDTGGKGLEA